MFGTTVSIAGLVSPVFSLSCRSESRFECTQADSTISANRPRLWKCVRARFLTSRHEDEILMTQMKAFLSPVRLNVGSREGLTRHWVLSLVTVARQHFQSKMSRWKNCRRKVTFQNVTVHTICSGSR